ncbi:MAG: hypothetical protein ACRDDZ_01350 [Marinifilaceae bacterium]
MIIINNDLARDIYECAKERGFHDESHSDAHYLMMIITEVTEAIEADRKGKRANLKQYNEWMGSDIVYKHNFTNAYNEWIKGSIEEELTDIVIRILDYAHARGDGMFMEKLPDYYPKFVENHTFTEIMFDLTEELSKGWTAHAINKIKHLSIHMRINLEFFIGIKMSYNQTRSKLHDKGY